MKKVNFLRFAKLLLWAALLISGYLAAVSLLAESVPGCADGSSCDSVLRGSWSHVFGIPVALLGLPLYALGIKLADDYAGGARRERWPVFLAQLCYGAVALAAFWFLGLQQFVLKQFCLWCCSVHLSVLTAITILVLVRRKHHKAGDGVVLPGAAPSFLTSRFRRPALLGAGLTLVATALTVGPTLSKRASIVADLHGQGVSPIVREQDTLTLLGQHSFDAKQLKRYGAPDAASSAVALVDFTCNFCRKYHKTLQDVSSSTQIYLLPTYHSAEGMQIQEMMQVALWTDEKKYDSVAEQIYAGSLNATEPEVRAALHNAFGTEVFAAASAKHAPQAQAVVERAKAVLSANAALAKSDRLPQLIKEDRVLVGYYEHASQVAAFLSAPSNAPSSLAQPAATQPPGLDPSSKLAPALVGLRYTDLGVQISGNEVPVQVVVRNPRPQMFKVAWFNLDSGLALQDGLTMEIPPQASVGVPLKLKVPAEAGEFAKRVRVMDGDGGEVLEMVVRGTAAPATALAK
jgi:uncharacterized membrane protein